MRSRRDPPCEGLLGIFAVLDKGFVVRRATRGVRIRISSTASVFAIGVMFLLTDATASIGGFADVDSQFSLQVWLRAVSDNVPDVAIVVLVAALVAAAWRRVRQRRRRARSDRGQRDT
ncbi:hypothetical protein [Amycolatopsis suaedae]|uniref:Uncharacterized protein n=1 Tax=Amycolatopsis suaedae TaxID=2510978 RepID=A0A4Q7J355_9PSEU|nr:hypothetical protein [Amycolatopsis suaedae]RZQ61042.1 hypothetical protein EWH70_26655 [Amycolatopsis suaedae]